MYEERKKRFLRQARMLGLDPCEVTREKEGDTIWAYFHGWAAVDRVFLQIDCDRTGVIHKVAGICEDENGMIKLINPQNIRFMRYFDEPV